MSRWPGSVQDGVIARTLGAAAQEFPARNLEPSERVRLAEDAMRRARVGVDDPKSDLTPIIDIVFNLLIFFLCATRLRADEGVIRAHLPKTMGLTSATSTEPLNDVRVRLLWHDGRGRRVEGEQGGHVVVAIGEHRLNEPGRLDAAVWRDLHRRLVELKAAATTDAFSVVIDARPQVPMQAVVSALNEVVRAEVPEVRFAAPGRAF
jgi:biopolymer transport protein ExbD